MTEQTTEMAKSVLRQATPWRAGMSWWLVLIEGLVALGIGLYVLLGTNTGNHMVLLLGLYLLILNAERALNGFRSRIPPVILGERMLIAGIGITVGLIIVLNAWQPFMTGIAPAVIISLGWLLIGAVGIWEWVTARTELGMGYPALIFPVFYAVFGLLMLGSRLALGALVVQAIGYVAIIAGVLLLGYAFLLYRKTNSGAAPTA